MFGHGHSTDLSQVSVYGLHYNRPSSDADDLNLYVYFEVEGESSSTGTIKGLPGSSVEWSGDNIHFKQKHSTSSPLQVKLYHKRSLMPDTVIVDGSIPWEAVLSQKSCELPVSSKQGHSGTVRFTVASARSTGDQPGIIPGTTSNTAGSQRGQGGQSSQYGSSQATQYAGYPNISPAPDSYQGGQRQQQQGGGTQFPPAPAYAGGQTGSQPYQSQLPHQGGGSQPPAYAGQSSGQTGYPGQGTGGYPGAGQVSGTSTTYGAGGGPGPVTNQTGPAGVKQAGYADKAKGFLHKNLDSLDKRMEQWNQPRAGSQQGGAQGTGRMGPTDPMVNAVGAAPAGSVPASSQQGNVSGQPRFTDIAKDTGSWTLNKLHQGVKLTKGLAADKPGTKPAPGSSTTNPTGQGYRS